MGRSCHSGGTEPQASQQHRSVGLCESRAWPFPMVPPPVSASFFRPRLGPGGDKGCSEGGLLGVSSWFGDSGIPFRWGSYREDSYRRGRCLRGL